MTLIQLKKKLVDWFNTHGQIKDVKYADDFEFNTERALNYPVANIEYLESNVANKTNTHSYKIVLGDIVDPNVEGMEDEVVSDMMQIAEDFITWLQYTEGFSFNRQTNIQKFSQDTSDVVSGVVFRVNLGVVRPQNECAKPIA